MSQLAPSHTHARTFSTRVVAWAKKKNLLLLLPPLVAAAAAAGPVNPDRGNLWSSGRSRLRRKETDISREAIRKRRLSVSLLFTPAQAISLFCLYWTAAP